MKSVWVIEQGSYSDYRVVGVYSSKKNAQLVCDAINAGESYDKATVAKWPVDESVLEVSRGYKRFIVTMLRDGTVENIRGPEAISSYDMSSTLTIWRRTQAPAYKGKGIPDALNGSVLAKDEKHAVKIANEQRTQMIALGRWP